MYPKAAIPIHGIFNLIKTKNNQIIYESGWKPNLILNSGKDMIGNLNSINSIVKACHIGSSTVTPAAGQTKLFNTLASTSTIVNTTVTEQRTAIPYYMGVRTQFSFPSGSEIKGISEIGVGPSATTGATLFNRSLMTSEEGTAIVLDVNADEQLYVYYELRVQPILFDVAWNEPSLSNGGIIRASRAKEILLYNNTNIIHLEGSCRGYDGAIGDFNGYPSGSSITGTATLQPYTNGTYYRDIEVKFTFSDGPLVNGIKSIMLGTINNRFNPGLQISFNNPIEKTSDTGLIYTLRYSWG